MYARSFSFLPFLKPIFRTFTVLSIAMLAGSLTSALAQDRTPPPTETEVIQQEQLQLNVFRQDASNLELYNSLNLRELQLQPGEKKVINLNRNISKVQSNFLTRVDPAILSSLDKQQVFSFPEIYVENPGSANNENIRISYQPIITSLKPLVFDHVSDRFLSKLNFLLLSDDQTSGSISSPMPIELHSDFLDNIQPSQLQIGHLNLPSTSVDISARDVRDSVQIRIVTETNTSGYETYLAVEPALDLFTERKSLQGLGIQEIPVQLSWKGSSSGETRTVTVSSSKGSVTPSTVELSYNQPTVVLLRSEGLGSASITASTAGISSNTLQIAYTFPWLFLLFSIAGGFVGGTAKYFSLKEKPKSFITTTIGSLSIGLLGAVAYFVLGINLLEIEISSTFNEFAVFGISALIAFFGIRKLKRESE